MCHPRSAMPSAVHPMVHRFAATVFGAAIAVAAAGCSSEPYIDHRPAWSPSGGTIA